MVIAMDKSSNNQLVFRNKNDLAVKLITKPAAEVNQNHHGHNYQPAKILASARGNMLVRIPPVKSEESCGNNILNAPPVFKLPPRPRIVLEEDEYIEALRRIITRDFFPENKDIQNLMYAIDREVEQLKKQNDIDLSGSSDEASANLNAARFLDQLAEETAVGPTEQKSESIDQKECDIRNLSLSQFQAKYTTEDNASFHSLLEKSNNDKRTKNAWLWQQNDRFKGSKDNMINTLTLRSKSAVVESWDITDPKNTVMFQPSGSFVSARSRAHQLSKTEIPQNTRFSLTPDERDQLVVTESSNKLPKQQSIALTLFPLEGPESTVPSQDEILHAIRQRPRSYSNASSVSILEPENIDSYDFLIMPPEKSTESPSLAGATENENFQKLTPKNSHYATREITNDSNSTTSNSHLGSNRIVGTPGFAGTLSRTRKRRDITLTPAGARVFNRLGSTSKSAFRAGRPCTPGSKELDQAFGSASNKMAGFDMSKKRKH
ncbi:hypothetical protein NADFUDRAFT_40551 [Nadsonia fulvescens var. elongata DSM 6958]|uniref:Uncharacterized protein n=1 Tax=Nadsonia fulvescens var. elongata DSM 6958 TaxID=857566 RepID=A0A1E3PPM8_9ASCO|nr:hypothetical protein NADFUDRAFT_40551 [Nadsonia fulvescens var. elongata DSM 6958]